MKKIYRDIELLRKEFKPAVVSMVKVIRHYRLPFRVFETWRSKERQEDEYKEGTTWTKKGNHPRGMAVDIVHYDKTKKSGKRWSWFVSTDYYILAFLIKFHVVRKFKYLGIRWGGDWKKRFDPYHWEMSKRR